MRKFFSYYVTENDVILCLVITYYVMIQILLAGALNVVGAICIGVAVSWFAANVLYDYHNPLSAGG